MYSQTSIDILKDRIGFGESLDSSVPDISVDNESGTSARLFSFFHRLVTPDNIWYSQPKELNESVFNDKLRQLRTDAVKSVLTKVFDETKEYDVNFDYSSIIEQRSELFENAIGYTMAATVLEEMVSSKRLNEYVKNVEISYQQLKIELEGAIDQKGNRISRGVKREIDISIDNIIRVIFSTELSISSPKVW